MLKFYYVGRSGVSGGVEQGGNVLGAVLAGEDLKINRAIPRGGSLGLERLECAVPVDHADVLHAGRTGFLHRRDVTLLAEDHARARQIGRASCRERVSPYT